MRARCEVLTDRVKQCPIRLAIDMRFNRLSGRRWSTGSSFSSSRDWYKEEQLNADGEEVTVKEGLRFNIPIRLGPTHQNSKPNQLNTDTGPEYAGYWMVKRYGEIAAKKNLWKHGAHRAIRTHSPTSRATAFYQQNGFAMNAPALNGSTGQRSNARLRHPRSRRTITITPVTISNHFERLVPSECGLGDYDYPVWFWFIVASDSTIL